MEEKVETKLKGIGFQINTLMNKVKTEINEQEEIKCRRSDQTNAALNVQRLRNQSTSSSRQHLWEKWNPHYLRNCAKCGEQSSVHTTENCPNRDKKKCYRCNQISDHIGVNRPLYGDHLPSKVQHPAGNSRNPTKRNTSPTNSAMKSRPDVRKKKVSLNCLKRLNLNRNKKGKALVLYDESDNDEKTAYVDANELDNEDYAFLFVDDVNQQEVGAAHTISGKPVFLESKFDFIIDCGATEHIVNRTNVFTTLQKLICPCKFTCANKNVSQIIRYRGDIILQNEETKSLVKLTNVYYCPEVPHNLFSALKVKDRLIFIINGDKTYIINKHTEKLIHIAYCDGWFWRLNFSLSVVDLGRIPLNERNDYILNMEQERGGSSELIKVHNSILKLPRVENFWRFHNF